MVRLRMVSAGEFFLRRIMGKSEAEEQLTSRAAMVEYDEHM